MNQENEMMSEKKIGMNTIEYIEKKFLKQNLCPMNYKRS
jgi:hypothetical protein